MNALGHNTTLINLLNKNQTLALNGRGTTNHCPMALTALAAMGATPERLQAFFEYWCEQYALPAVRSMRNIEYDGFSAYVGKKEFFPDLQDCFARRIASEGIASVINDVLEVIHVAPATSAFHALIRLAYGLQAEHASEVAAGLAALVTANFKIEVSMDRRHTASSIFAGFQALSTAMHGKKYPGKWIVERMRDVLDDEQFHQCFLSMPVSDDLLDELALWAISAYWQTKDFIVLHMVTGIDAARQVLPYFNEGLARVYMREMWLALCVAYVSVGSPNLMDVDTCLNRIVMDYAYLTPWPDLMRQAMLSNDDHVIKFTYTCSREAHARPHALYQAAVMDLLQSHLESAA